MGGGGYTHAAPQRKGFAGKKSGSGNAADSVIDVDKLDGNSKNPIPEVAMPGRCKLPA